MIIELLFNLLDVPEYGIPSEKEKEKIDAWLSDSWQHPGFQTWVKHRDRELLKATGSLGMSLEPRDKYIRAIGQRFELQRFVVSVKKAYQNKVGKLKK